jgi:hypothetical protein
MKKNDCKHPKLWDSKTNKMVKTSCPDCGWKASTSTEEIAEVTNEISQRVTDDAEVRKILRITEDASALPQTVQYLRRFYPNYSSTAEIATALSMTKEAVRSELNDSRRVEKRPGKAHGDINAASWRYRPTASETPWSSKYQLEF